MLPGSTSSPLGSKREVRTGGNCAHSYEDKVDAAAALETRDRSAAEVASERGLAREALCSRKCDLLGRRVPCSMSRNDARTKDTGALEARIAELEGRVGGLELRKAMLEGTVELLG